MIKDKNLKFALLTLSVLFVTAFSITTIFYLYHNINLQKKEREKIQNKIEQENLERFQKELEIKELKEKEKLDTKVFWNKKSYSLESIKNIFEIDDGYEILTIKDHKNLESIKLDKSGKKISTKQISQNPTFSDYFDLTKIKNKDAQIESNILAKINLEKGFHFDGAIYIDGKNLVIAHKYNPPNKFYAYLLIYDFDFKKISEKLLASFVPKQTKHGQIAKFKMAEFGSGFLFIAFLERFDDETEGQFDFREFDLDGNLIDKAVVGDYPPYTKINCVKTIDNGVLIGGETFYDDISQKVFNHEITNTAFSKKEAILIKIDSNASLSEQKIKPFGGKFERKAWED